MARQRRHELYQTLLRSGWIDVWRDYPRGTGPPALDDSAPAAAKDGTGATLSDREGGMGGRRTEIEHWRVRELSMPAELTLRDRVSMCEYVR